MHICSAQPASQLCFLMLLEQFVNQSVYIVYNGTCIFQALGSSGNSKHLWLIIFFFTNYCF